ncbi:MAG: hypothetical protein LBH10_06445 [Burkholderiaceae bacterium]|nr:hypothetical protein [Burkholderiaceae bacterium]
MSQSNLQPVTALATLAAMVFSPQVSYIVWPYIVIVIAALLGAYFRLGQRGADTIGGAFAFFSVTAAVSILLTVPLCDLAHAWIFNSMELEWMFGPVSFCIGLIGERWPLIGQWAARKLGMLVDVLIRRKSGDGPADAPREDGHE